MLDERWILLRIPLPTPAEIAAFADLLERDGRHLMWTGPTDDPERRGYGRARYRLKTFKAHRLAFAFVHGGLPPKPFMVAHRCDRKLCCAPGCLLNSTGPENSDDLWRFREERWISTLPRRDRRA